ncbi:arabinoxylan arabinofuranohydrolase [Parabacteroides sp. PFB2-12]|uniref:family 43 glycosylhydrolase n=1 Tax=unclassified Parabacteroides TaxID=2649774 RepID=UPI002476203F|nr:MULTISPECIES: family 43 glycosylhydrolase [unclassified Parabacteroides]MDH6342202.1 arabinoxylan arabinofuranohydrolase [Parabacteroides sp. PM6-13]MDH6391114.1 arabinoxylan arabinofuranohydrolase [Parabacteroides sp. PFB2-12]
MKKNIRTILVSLLLFGTTLSYGQAYKSGPEEKDFAGYLFAYFLGNKVEQEAVCYAISRDGYNYLALNNNQPVLDSKQISSTGGVRDPHILRSADGKTFYMVVTDMTSSKGWDSNRAMVLLKSNDLINWTSSIINIQQKYPNQENLKRVWAPQTIFDPNVGKYMVYWSMKHGDGPDIIYYAYANEDFTDLEGEPKVFFTPKNGKSCIDGDVVYKNGLYYMFYKTEGHGNGIRLAITDELGTDKWIEQPGYKQQTRDAVEGSSLFKLINSDTYILMYDVYTKGKYQFCESKDLDVFKVIDKEISMNFHPRHGSIIPLTRRELKAITDRWGVPEGFEMPTDVNPIIEGYYADPEVMYSKKTGKYYIYPTSDGFEGWGGYYFKTFSSPDLKEWTEEGIILNHRTDVSWADGNAWAPCIIEKEVGKNKYKYYYYFSGGKPGEPKKIGVAVADDPTGPFVDSGKPLIDFKPEGINRGQEIDPDVFFDPIGKKYYLYWGNGYLGAAQLNKDMVSINKKTMKVMTPDKTFREAVYVFYRNGLYYFLWSEDDTGSPNYKVRYATAKSPLGPLTIPENNVVITLDPSRGIYGTGHNSVLQVPGTDEWYIVYHRISRPNGITMPYPGIYREVCMDKMEFNEDGSIKQVTPSL